MLLTALICLLGVCFNGFVVAAMDWQMAIPLNLF